MTSDSAYDGTRLSAGDSRRRLLLDAAIELLSEQGADALSVRTLAQAVGASTKVIYTHFGGKDGVIEAIYDDAFARLTATLADAAATSGSIRVRLEAAIAAYRDFAIQNPRLFELMYSPVVRDLRPDRGDREAAFPTLQILTDLYAEIDSDTSETPGRAFARARNLWAGAHGVISLELTNWFDHDEADQRFDDVVSAILAASTAP